MLRSSIKCVLQSGTLPERCKGFRHPIRRFRVNNGPLTLHCEGSLSRLSEHFRKENSGAGLGPSSSTLLLTSERAFSGRNPWRGGRGLRGDSGSAECPRLSALRGSEFRSSEHRISRDSSDAALRASHLEMRHPRGRRRRSQPELAGRIEDRPQNDPNDLTGRSSFDGRSLSIRICPESSDPWHSP